MNLRQFEIWDAKEEIKLNELFKNGFNDQEISLVLFRNKSSIEKKRQRLGFFKNTYHKKWTDEEIRKLRFLKFKKRESNRSIANKVGKSLKSIESKLRSLER